jgi:hypothetical protein
MKKYYIRLTSKNDDVYNSEIATSVALMLTHTNYIKVFNGKNFNSQEIIVNKDFFIKSKKSLGKSNGKSNNLSKRKLLIDFQEDDAFDVINFFKKVIEEKEKNVGLYKFCKVKDVLNELSIKAPTSRTKEECIENARKFNSIKEWRKNYPSIWSYTIRKDWYLECTAHMDKFWIKSPRTKEECIEDARKFNSIKEWRKNSSTIYNYSKFKGWLDECKIHMRKLNGKNRTKEECIESAKKYTSIKDWRIYDTKYYQYAKRLKWLDECTHHMIKLNTSRTKQECIENAKQYNSRIEWLKNDKVFFQYAEKKKWLIECMAHMKNVRFNKSRTKEECIENAKKYTSIKDWIKNDDAFYQYASNKKWLDECTPHMIKLRTSRTKQECIEDAKKYTSIKDWEENSYTTFRYASKKGWLQEIKSLVFNQ